MEFYSKKPIRIDYYPKTKEDMDEFEKPEDILNEGVDYEEEPVEEDNMKCDSCMIEDMGVMEKVIEEMIEDVEEEAEDIEDIEKEAEDIKDIGDIEKETEDIEEVKKDEAEEYIENSIYEETTDDMKEAEEAEENIIIMECEED